MTTIASERWRCPVCETESEQAVVLGTNALGGACDLDLRPAGMARSTLADSIWSCPGCGFAAVPRSEREAGRAVAAVAELVRSERYRAQRRDPAHPQPANAFVCRALLREGAGELAEAGWDALRAAWVCDDAGEAPAAARCRERAIGLWQRALRERREVVRGGVAPTRLLLTDVLRRAGRFEEARAVCHRGLSGRPKDPVRSLLEYELELITRRDTDAHSIGEVLGPR